MTTRATNERNHIMTDPMTPERLAEIEARANAATVLEVPND